MLLKEQMRRMEMAETCLHTVAAQYRMTYH